MITDAFSSKSNLSFGERILSFSLGLILEPAHWVDKKLKDAGIDSDGELEEWEVRKP